MLNYLSGIQLQLSKSMNHFQDYSEFLQTGTDPGANYSNSYTKNSSAKGVQDDLCSPSDIDAMLKKKFYAHPYPLDLTTQNIFCPLCGKEVLSTQNNLVYQSALYCRKFLAHTSCLNEEVSIFLSDQFDNVEEMKIQKWAPAKKLKPLSIGDREFCLQLSISHPLSGFKFIKLISKGILNGNTIRWELREESSQNCYLPNMICFPYVDFKIVLTLSQIGLGDDKKIITNYVNLSRNKSLQMQSLIAKSDQITLQIMIHSSEEAKEEAIDQMNYKYRYRKGLKLPIVELLAIEVQVPDLQQSQQNTNSNIVEQMLFQKDEKSQSFISSSYYNSSVHSKPINRYGHDVKKMSVNSSPDKDKLYLAEKQQFDLQKLVTTNKLALYVKNNVQSRIVQNFLAQASNEQVQMILKALYDDLGSLIIDLHANYMVQKLFLVCIPSQRIRILQRLFEQIPDLVRNKQGTHSIQYFVSLLTDQSQYKLICGSIQTQFESLSFHQQSTHFIRKLIKQMPLVHTIHLFHFANKHFLKFAIDKNGVCVIKQMVEKLKQFQSSELTFDIKKHFINSMTFNIDAIIQDCFGNYIVQFCYQKFGEKKLLGITEMIIEKFAQFSIQKYSSSVVWNCINTYWTDKSYLIRLKDTLRNQNIMEMYRNREGNKILLAIMDKNQNTPIRDKIFNVLVSVREPSNFNHDKWGFQIGIRSGPVGFEARSFGQAEYLARKPKESSFKDGSTKKSKKK